MSFEEEEEEIPYYKIVLIGDMNVGKTSIISRFSEDKFSGDYISTIGVDFRYKNVDVDGTTVRLQVWDTAGQERFQAISKNFYRGAHGIIIVYAIDDVRSFQNVRKWLTEIDNVEGSNDGGKNKSGQHIVRYLVGNKSDLVKSRSVDVNNGRLLAETYQIKFFEASAKTAFNIEEMFTEIARDIRNNSPEAQKKSQIDLEKSKSGGCC